MGPISGEAILDQARTLLTDQAVVIRNNQVPETDLQRWSEVIRDFLDQQACHMQHYRYGWNDLQATPALFQGFVREVLQ